MSGEDVKGFVWYLQQRQRGISSASEPEKKEHTDGTALKTLHCRQHSQLLFCLDTPYVALSPVENPSSRFMRCNRRRMYIYITS